jgi:energy-coupling factor transporter ATP-binding protein EcfA2
MSVRLGGVSFRYPGSDTDALHEVSVALRPGEVTLVTGRLGAGCSTLLLVMAGLAPQATNGTRTGEVTTLDRDPATRDGRKVLAGRVGLLLPTPWTQLSGMSFTVEEEVAFGPANLGWRRPRIAETVEWAMERFEVAHLARRDPRTLSGGELQCVMFAGVLAMEPEVLLLDEPALELDPAGAASMYEMLPSLAEERTVVLASTDLDRAVAVAHRALLLDRGSLVADGPAGEVLGSDGAVATGCSTTIAEIARAVGLTPGYPLTVADAVQRMRR